MGREIAEVAVSRGHRLAAVIHPSSDEPRRRSVGREALAGADVAIEFTRPDAAVANIAALLECGCRHIVVGTTGWKDRLPTVERMVREARGGLVHADNFSLGMALYTRVVERAAGLLGQAGYASWIAEWHHAGKRDAPSGTARSLAGVVERAVPGTTRHEGDLREGLPPGTFPVAAIRAGWIPGTHTVGFESEFDSIELTHRARGRGGFALGAVLAAEWIVDREGVFTFSDLLDDRGGTREASRGAPGRKS